MSEVKARVELLAHTPEPLSLIYAAFRQCYHAGDVADMWPRLLAGDISRESRPPLWKTSWRPAMPAPLST